ncbi:hypothetical protein J4429_05145 [Candidatus Pacearchaeota archaeon]|nr:hypothetical protein [Candidatus Pacearchaeota archaeon]
MPLISKIIKKKAQSEVVATILLILLVVTAIGIITAFAIPFVRNQISKSDCLSVIGEDKLGISESMQYTCYNVSVSGNEMFVQIHIGDIYDKINGFSIELGGATTNTYDITKDSVSAGVSSYGSEIVEVPNATTERTYRISVAEAPQRLRVYPILTNGGKCDYSDSLTSIPACFSP